MKYDSKTHRRRLLRASMRALLALVLVGLLVVPLAVQADLKATNIVYSWDFKTDKFENGDVIIPWNGPDIWIPFLHELFFDGDVWLDAGGLPAPTCGAGETTTWAGEMYYGLYHLDDAPLNAPGFQETQVWSLISCDRDGDLDFDNGDRSYPLVWTGNVPTKNDPSTATPVWERGLVYADCVPDDGDPTTNYYCTVIEKDAPVGCPLGNCLEEIVTTLLVNLDLDCDGVVDPHFPVIEKGDDPTAWQPDMLCFYAEARVPDPEDHEYGVLPFWSGPLQARINTVGGEKTVNFSNDTTAVEVAAFDAAPQDNGVMLTWETATELDNLGFNIYRAQSQVGELIKLNPSLIASKTLGSLTGASYSFLDDSAMPGVTYYYWLEDIDAFGGSSRHGPVVAQRGVARSLPGRLRPPPMPANAF